MEGVDEVDTENLSGVVQPMATIYDAEAIEALRKQAAVQPQTLKQFRNRLFKQAAASKKMGRMNAAEEVVALIEAVGSRDE